MNSSWKFQYLGPTVNDKSDIAIKLVMQYAINATVSTLDIRSCDMWIKKIQLSYNYPFS